jgi:O-antigen ligase
MKTYTGGAQAATRDVKSDGFGLAAWSCWTFIVVAVGRIAEVIPVLSFIPLAKITLFVWLIAVLRLPKRKGVSLVSLPIGATALMLFMWGMVSFSFSISLVASWHFFVINGVILFISYVLMSKTITNWKIVRGTLLSFVVCAAMLSAVTLLSYGGGRAAFGTMYDTNDLAYNLVTILPIALAFTVTSSGIRRITFAGTTVVVLAAALLTQSRGGVLGLLSVVLFLILRPLSLPEPDASLKMKRGGALVRLIVVCTVAALTWAVLPTETKARFATISNLDADYNTDQSNLHSRSSIWTRNLTALMSRPIGFGLNAFPVADVRNGGAYMTAHNSLILILVELGFVGLFFYLRMYFLAWKGLSKIENSDESAAEVVEQALFARALQMSLLANFVAGFFLSMSYSYVLWLLMATITVFFMLKQPARSGYTIRAKYGAS